MACPMGGPEGCFTCPGPIPESSRDDVVRVARQRGPGVTLESIAEDFGIPSDDARQGVKLRSMPMFPVVERRAASSRPIGDRDERHPHRQADAGYRATFRP